MSSGRLGIIAVAVALASVGCAGGTPPLRTASDVAVHGTDDLVTLARRFAPVLRLHADEPFALVDVVAVLHPEHPLIAYHVFFAGDVVYPHSGERIDHEIVWVEYDPISLKVADVATYWHRTVLRTGECVAEAQRASQQPTVDVQWGQHGMLPLGWEALRTARPRLELRLYYNIVRRSSGAVFPTHEKAIAFEGDYDDYTRFATPVDLAGFIDPGRVAVARNPEGVLAARIADDFARKKHWPDE